MQTLTTTTIAPQQVAQIVQAASYQQHQQPPPKESGNVQHTSNPFVSYLNQQASAMVVR